MGKGKNKVLLVVLSSPSGGGKTVIAEKLLKKHPEFSRSVSVTTRRKRPGEKDGVHYYFVKRADFQKKIKRGEFAEWAKVFGDYYGTPKKNIRKAEGEKEVLLLVLDVQGGIALKRKYPRSVLIFILPPSLPELRRRLVNRGTDDPEVIRKRLKLALKEISYAGKYDYLVVNENLSQTVELIEKVIISGEQKTKRVAADNLLRKLKLESK
jgi:guanylate kinase